MRKFYQPAIVVYCNTCKEWLDERKVRATNIEENLYGEDVLTFTCKKCGQESKSLRRG